MPTYFPDVLNGCYGFPDADPNVVQTIPGVKRRTDKALVQDAVKAAVACGKLREDEPHHFREEPDGGVSIVRGVAVEAKSA